VFFHVACIRELGIQKKEPAEKANPAETRHPVSKLPKPCQILQAVGFQILQKVLLLALIQVAVSLAGWAHFAEEVDRGHEGESYAVKHAT
jgi:hypothetical protein